VGGFFILWSFTVKDQLNCAEMKQELTLAEALRSEIEYEEKRYEHALFTGKPIEQLQVIQKQIEYLKTTLEIIEERYDTPEKHIV
jgi:hypothetical protein